MGFKEERWEKVRTAAKFGFGNCWCMALFVLLEVEGGRC